MGGGGLRNIDVCFAAAEKILLKMLLWPISTIINPARSITWIICFLQIN